VYWKKIKHLLETSLQGQHPLEGTFVCDLLSGVMVAEKEETV